jgi:hypothetical protein
MFIPDLVLGLQICITYNFLGILEKSKHLEAILYTNPKPKGFLPFHGKISSSP